MQQWVRISAKVAAGILSAWLLLLPVTVNALGFGNIKMKSALNEPLNAEIELLSATSDDIKGLKVNLASREAFLRAGVDRSVLLSQMKFNIVKHNGKYFVTLTTPTPVREPFLNFLLELNWKNGRMLREYTVLLDPAERLEKQRVATAPETTPPLAAPEQAPAPAPEAAAPEQMPVPTSPFMQAPEAVAEAPAPEPAETTEAQAEQPLFPAVPLEQAPQAPATESQAAAPEPAPTPAPMAAPEPMAVPEPMAAAPEAMPEPAPAEAPVPAAMPEEAEAPKEAMAEAPAPEPVFEGTEEEGLYPQIPLRAYSEATEAEAPMPAPAGEATAPQEAYQPVGELDYGITKKGDNLWRIAERLKPNDQITIYQVMMALQQSNPKAFVDGNIHRLKVGQVMRIDDPNLLTAMSKADAEHQYQTQTQDWEGYLARVGAQVPRQAIEAGEQTTAPAASGVPTGELTLATPQSEQMSAGAGGTQAGGADAALLEQQARKAMEEARTERKKNAELTARLSDLETELKRLENLVTIKDSDLATLQRKLDELNAQRAVSGTPEPATTTEPEQTPQVAAAPQPEPVPEVAKPEEQPTPPAAEPEPTPEPMASTEPEQAQPAQPAEPTPPPVAAPAPAPTPVPQPMTAPAKDTGIMGMLKGFFGGVMGGMNAMMLIIGGVVLLVLVLLVVIMIRRRKGVNFQESILSGGKSGGEDSISMDTSPSQGSSMMGGESSFLSDFAISGVSAIQTEDSEVDPLTEADVFMAYGRYEAAEERLQEAINQDPKRGELRVKLLELYNTTKNKQAFESSAEDFYAALGGNVSGNPLWQKVVAMGRELVPSNPLFTGGVAAAASAQVEAPAAPVMEERQDVMDIGLDTGVFNTSDFSTDAFNAPAKAEPSHMDSGLDFNLDMGQPESDLTTESLGGSADAGLDFSLDTAPTESASDLGLDFDMQSAAESTAGDLDFNLEPETAEMSEPATRDDLDFNLNLEGDEEPTATEIKLGLEDEKSDLDFDFASETAGGDMDLGGSDASMNLDLTGGGDEVGTKLDLARAYIDMGDPDGARSILDEVMEEGSAGQKQEAEQLMAQIG